MDPNQRTSGALLGVYIPSLPPINPFIYLQTTNPYLIHIHALHEGYLGLTFLLPPPKNLDRAAADITQLLRRFENILAFESVRLFFLVS